MCLLKLILFCFGFWFFFKYHLTNPIPVFSFVPDSSSKPKVECSVVTEFTDHICVTMDAELIMFLHDLVSAYLKEKEKGFVFSMLLIDVSLSVNRKKNPTIMFIHFNCPQIYDSTSHEKKHPPEFQALYSLSRIWVIKPSEEKTTRLSTSVGLCTCEAVRVLFQIFGSSVTRSRLTVTFTHSRQVREPDARSILMGFKSSQRNKLALFMPVISLSSPQLKQPRLCSVDSAAK